MSFLAAAAVRGSTVQNVHAMLEAGIGLAVDLVSV